MHARTPQHISIDRLTIKAMLGGLLALLLVGCAGPKMKEELIRFEPGFARAPASEGVLADMANSIFSQYGPEFSGFKLLDSSLDGLQWRIALIDSAVSSVDIQTYLWYPDNAGRLILERAVLAAKRGVHVRMIVDDLLTMERRAIMLADPLKSTGETKITVKVGYQMSTEITVQVAPEMSED